MNNLSLAQHHWDQAIASGVIEGFVPDAVFLDHVKEVVTGRATPQQLIDHSIKMALEVEREAV